MTTTLNTTRRRPPDARRRRPAPTTQRPDGPPSRDGLAGELRTLREPFRLLARTPRLLRAPRGDGSVVIDVPGWKAPEASMAPLRGYLRRLGHDARGWGLGTNEGEVELDAERFGEVVAEAARRSGPVSLVGWSLGGVIAREVAREQPDDVERLVTYGSPVIGGPTHTLGATAYGREENERIAGLVEQSDRERPITVPITAIYTRADRIVSWLACLDHTSVDVDHVEVTSTHLGLGIDPDVWEAVANALAA